MLRIVTPVSVPIHHALLQKFPCKLLFFESFQCFFNLQQIIYIYTYSFSSCFQKMVYVLYILLLLAFFTLYYLKKKFFLGPHLGHMEVPRIEVKLELQLPAYAQTTAMWDPSRICDLHHSLWQHQILNPLSKTRDQTLHPHAYQADSFMLSHNGNSLFTSLYILANFPQ